MRISNEAYMLNGNSQDWNLPPTDYIMPTAPPSDNAYLQIQYFYVNKKAHTTHES